MLGINLMPFRKLFLKILFLTIGLLILSTLFSFTENLMKMKMMIEIAPNLSETCLLKIRKKIIGPSRKSLLSKRTMVMKLNLNKN